MSPIERRRLARTTAAAATTAARDIAAACISGTLLLRRRLIPHHPSDSRPQPSSHREDAGAAVRGCSQFSTRSCHFARDALPGVRGRCSGPRSRAGLEEIATALADQTDYEHRWLINPQTGEIVFWTADGGVDGRTPVDLDDLDLVCIEPLPSYVWYQDMADFAERISDEAVGRRLARAIRGKGAFRRFKDELHEEYPHLLPVWHTFRDVRAQRRAVEWLADNSLVDDETATRFVTEHRDPDLP
ncbi:UPF0158 family protein [Micromonospora sp. DT47]|uniref:UPF0158 family protein n=1 Tax=Micromonospora sp. DT47 TaxID=3393431 RepID=UPI003CFA5734